MIIKEILIQLETALNPVIKILKKGENFKIIAMGFKKGMILKEHQTPILAKLLVIDGKINYIESDRTVTLDKFGELDIPVNVIHAVEALEDSVCLLFQG